MTEALDPRSGLLDLDRAVTVRPDDLLRNPGMSVAYARFVGELGSVGVDADGMTERWDGRRLASVTALARTYPLTEGNDSRAGLRALAALTDVVQRQLAGTGLQLYWIVQGSGPDRPHHGVLATAELAERAFRQHGYRTATIPESDLTGTLSAPLTPTTVPVVDAVTGEIDHDQAVMLDAEELAEGGIAAAYAEMSTVLTGLGVEPDPVRDRVTDDAYSVEYRDQVYEIYGPDLDDEAGRSWVRATFTLFDIVNRQLMRGPRLLYAVNGGNDLSGVLLDDAELDRARAALPDPRDWPYLPTLIPPHFGAPAAG